MNYHELPLLKNIYLEDSYVLNIKEKKEFLAFNLEVALAEENPSYTPPIPGEQYCYKRAALIFYGVSSVNWLERRFSEAKDESGSVDYGNIDVFRIDDDMYTLSGDWGTVAFKCKNFDFRLI